MRCAFLFALILPVVFGSAACRGHAPRAVTADEAGTLKPAKPQPATRTGATTASGGWLRLLLHLDAKAGQLVDASGEGNKVAVTGAAAGAAGRFGKCLTFDGKDDSVTIAGASLHFPAQTVEMWVEPADGGAGGIIGSQKDATGASWGWYLARNADGTVSFHVYDRRHKNSRDREVKSVTKLPAGTWTHVAVTVDALQAKKATLYINGKAEAATEVTSHRPAGQLHLGAGAAGYFAGAIDEVAIYAKALPPAEIALRAAAKAPLRSEVTGEHIILRPVADTTGIVFRHPQLPGLQWSFRIPEHGYYDRKLQRSMRPHDVRWAVSPDRRRMTLRCDLPEAKKKEVGLDFWGTVTSDKDTIAFELHVKNVSAETWTHQQMGLFCLSSRAAPIFHDYDAKRTYVHRGEKWMTVNEAIQGKFASHRMVSVKVRLARGDAKRIAAKVSKDGTFVLGLATDIAGHLSFNFNDRTACIHSNPAWGMLKGGQEVTAKGKAYLGKMTLGELYKRYTADFEGGEE